MILITGTDGFFRWKKHEDSGIFELFIPEMKAGTAYKYEIKFKGGNIAVKTDRTADSATPVRGFCNRLCMQIFRLHGKMVHGRRRRKPGYRKEPAAIYEISLETCRQIKNRSSSRHRLQNLDTHILNCRRQRSMTADAEISGKQQAISHLRIFLVRRMT